MTKYILPDNYFAEGVLPTKEQIERQEKFTIDWVPQDQMMQQVMHTAKDRISNFTDDLGYPFFETENGHIEKPGMLPAAEGSAFLAERTYQSVFHNKCAFERITSYDNKYIFYDTMGRLQSLRHLEDGKQKVRSEVDPDSNRAKEKILHAEPYVETAEFTQTMVWDNLIGNRLLQAYLNSLSARRDYNMGILELYSKFDKDAADTDGLHANNGLFVQLDDTYNFYKENIEDNKSWLYGQGYYCGIHGTGTDKVPIDFSKDDRTKRGNYVEQLVDMNTQYLTQQGFNGQEFLVGYEVYGQLQKMASQRETERGDKLYFDGDKLRINGTNITPCMELGMPENGYNQHILLGNFQTGVVNGMREDFQTKAFYDDNEFKWKFNTFVYFGTLLKYEQDVLAAEVINLPTQLAQAGNNNGSSAGAAEGEASGDGPSLDDPDNGQGSSP